MSTPGGNGPELADLFGEEPGANDLTSLFGDAAAEPAPTTAAPAAPRLGTPGRARPLRVKAEPAGNAPSVPAVPRAAEPAPVAAPIAEPSFTPAPVYAATKEQRPVTGKMHAGNLGRRFTDGARLWPIVDQVLAIAGADVKIQQRAAQLELLRDVEADTIQREELLNVLRSRLGAEGLQITDPSDIAPVLQMAYDELVGISVLGDLWRDDSITEVLVDRWDRVVIERAGRLELTPISFRSPEHASSIARSLALRVSQRALSRSINLVTAELPQARVQFAYGPVVKGGLSIALRKFARLLTLEDLRRFNTLDDQMEAFLRDAVKARASILVSGGTGTGKTTIINLLSSFIPDSERVVTIEDAFELQLANTHVVSLQTKEASSADDAVAVNLASLLRATLRMRPDRIIVGEIREGEGAEVMLAAANTGHEGTMTTIHANSADMAINERIVDLVRQVRNSGDDAIRRTVSSAFDIVLQVDRGRRGNRFISNVSQVDRTLLTDGMIAPAPIFTAEDDGAGKPQFRRVGSIRPDTALGKRLADLPGGEQWIGR
jgi:pilus assembly protein CpaF